MPPIHTDSQDVVYTNHDEGYKAELTLHVSVYAGDSGVTHGPSDGWVEPCGNTVDVDVQVNSVERLNYDEDGNPTEVILHVYDNDAERADGAAIVNPIVKDFKGSIRCLRIEEFYANQ
jgi:hypothetical protein